MQTRRNFRLKMVHSIVLKSMVYRAYIDNVKGKLRKKKKDRCEFITDARKKWFINNDYLNEC